MSNPANDPNNSLITFWAAIAGGLLSSIGGFFAVVIRARMDKKTEINYIKTALIDELTEISSIVDKMRETQKTAHIISNSYLNDLNKNQESFNYHKLRIFLIRDDKLRRSIVSFYKNLDEIIQDSINKVGSLAGDASTNTHDQIATQFTSIKNQSESLIKSLTDYKYKVFLIC